MGVRAKYLDVVSAIFVTVLVVSNIASSAKIVDMGFSIFSIRLAFDGGTLLFPLVYVLGSVLTEVYGFKTASRVIWTGFAGLALAMLVFFVLGILPGEAHWEAATGQPAYNAILGGMSHGGIVLASLTAYLFGKFTNAAIHSKIKVIMKGRMLWVRTIGSTMAGQLLDTFIFISIASVAGVFPWEIFWSLVIANYLIKCFFEVVLTPLNYLVCGVLKRKEDLDVYDA